MITKYNFKRGSFTVDSVADSDCIIRQRLKYSDLIFDDDKTTCQPLDPEVGVTSIRLEVKPSCVKMSEVRFFSNDTTIIISFHINRMN